MSTDAVVLHVVFASTIWILSILNMEAKDRIKGFLFISVLVLPAYGRVLGAW